MADSLMRRLRFAHRPLIGSALSVGAITAFARLNGAVREVWIARQFGTTSELEIFLVGFGVITMIAVGVLGALPGALVPTHFRLGAAGPGRLGEVLGSLSSRLLGLLVLGAGAVVMASPLIVGVAGGGLAAPDRVTLRTVLVVLAPALPLGGMASFFSAALNAEERFVRAAVPQVVNPLATLAALLLFSVESAVGLALAFLVGAVVELVAALGLLFLSGVRLRRAPAEVAKSDWKFFLHLLLPLVVVLALQAADTVVDQAVATHLSRGDVAVLAFGSRIPAFIAGVGITAVGTVVLPQFSRLLSNERYDELAASLRMKVAMVLIAAAAFACLVTIVGRPMLDAVFGGGEFTEADVSAAAAVQAIAIWQLPFHLVAALLIRLLTVQRQLRALLALNAATLFLNLGLNVLLATWLGVRGIALATACVVTLRCVVFWSLVRRRLPARVSLGERAV